MRFSRLSVLLALFALLAVGQQAPFVPITGPNAPKRSACLLEDTIRGGLWLGGAEAGAEGLLYFDGNRFISPVPDFPKVFVSGMAEDSDGGIWIASNAGIYRAFRGKLKKLVNGSVYWGITQVAHDVFLASVARLGADAAIEKSNVIRLDRIGDGWRAETAAINVWGARFSVDHPGNVLYQCPGGYCEMSGSDIRNWHPGSTLAVRRHAFAGGDLMSVVQKDRFGCVWMRSVTTVRYQCPTDRQPVTLPTKAASSGAGPLEILELADGTMVIPSHGTLATGRPGKWRVLTRANNYQTFVFALVAQDGNIWLTNGGGLFVFPMHLKMEFWNENNGLDGNTWSVLPIGGKLFGIADNTVRALNGDRSRWRLLTEFAEATHLSPGPDNTILASSRTAGIAQISLSGRILRKSDASFATTLAQTRDGQVWMNGDQVAKVGLKGNRLNLHSVKDAGPRGQGSDMKIDRNGGLWTCGSDGLGHRDDLGWHFLSTKHGLLENQCRSFAVDSKGDVWYGYERVAAFSWIQGPTGNRPQIHHFRDGGDIGFAETNFLDSDRRGWIWRGTEDGVYVANLEQARQGQWLYLNRTDGLPNVDINRRSFTEDQDGSVWFGESTAIVHLFPPDDLVRPSYAPSVFVSGFSWNGSAFQMADMVDKIEHGADIIAHIGSLQFDRRNSLRLRYRMLPEQAAWKPERDLDIGLGKLSWGKHTLEVQARLYTGPWSGTVSKSFTVLKPIWLSWPALLGFAVAGGLAATGSYERWKKRRRRAQTPLPELADWRLTVLSPEASSVEGTLLDERFEVGRIIARGGFATVFEGRDLLESRPCAVKIFRHELSEKSWMRRRFEQEVSALKQIKHVNVVGIYGHGSATNGAPYLAMELIEGETLREALNKTKLDLPRVASYLRQTGRALAEIHAQRICHRDLKPENLMIRNAGVPGEDLVLIDFSIAIVQDPDETLHGLSRAAGTLQYMAPEQAIGYADASSDIYSLAKILLEMLTGQRLSHLLPDASMDLPARIRELLNETPFGLAPASIDLIARALEFDPSRRPNNAREFTVQIAAGLETRL